MRVAQRPTAARQHPGRKTRSRRRAARPRWLLALPALGILAVAAWWWAGRAPEGASGSSIATFRPPDVHSLAVAADEPATVLFGSHAGMLVSRDGGRSWQPLGPSGDAMDIAIPPGARTAYAAGHDAFFRSDDGGRSWSRARPALPGTDIHGLAASPTRAGTFYAHVVGFGLYRTGDAGQTWSRAGDIPGSTMSLSVAAADGADVLFASTMEGVQRSRDGGASWDRLPELGAAHVGAAGATAYAATGQSVFLSANGGATWQRRIFPKGSAVLVAAAPAQPEMVYVLAKDLSVWRSVDGGRTWEKAG